MILQKSLWSVLGAAICLTVILGMVAPTTADPDLWGHIRFGLDMMRDGTITRVDPYSYMTGSQPWINHEWLAEFLFAFAWSIGGPTGLIGIKVVIILLTMGVVYRHLRSTLTPLRAFILILVLTEVLLPFLSMARPQLFTALFFAVILYVISLAEGGYPHWVWLLPPAMALWANLHGGFLAGIGILVIWSVSRILLRRRLPANVIIAVLASILATTANPYNVRLITFLLKTATVPRPEITDWQPVQWTSLLGIMYLALLAVATASLIFSRKRLEAVPLVLVLVSAALPFAAVRHILLAAIALVMLAGAHMGERLAAFSKQQSLQTGVSMPTPVIAGMLVMAVIAWQPSSFRRILLPDEFYPVAAVNLLKQSGIAGNMAVHFPWGEYVIWHLGPRVKVAVDGRRETVYSGAAYRKAIHFQYGLADWDALLSEHPTNIALVGKNTPAYRLMCLKEGWFMAFEDKISALFVRDPELCGKLLHEKARIPAPPAEVQSFP